MVFPDGRSGRLFVNTPEPNSMPVADQSPPLERSVVIFFALSNLAALTVVPWYGVTHGYSAALWLFAGLLWMLNGIGITAGYHRLWSHRTYSARWPLRLFLLIAGTMALQNSVLMWASRHRSHHRHTDDNDRDPYSAGLGLWHSHMGWMLRKWSSTEVDYSNVPDLQRDPMLRWQHRRYYSIVWATNLGIPLLVGWMLGDILGAVLLAGVLRLVVNHHTTFFINSLAHKIGRQPYSDATSARDSNLLATVTWGEGYHNFHHAFPADYRNGVRWWQIDIGKWFINLCAWLGLARNLRRVPTFQIRRAKLPMLFKRAQARLAEQPADSYWRDLLEQEYETFSATVRRWQALQREYMQAGRRALSDRFQHSRLRTAIRELEFSLRQQRIRLHALLAEAPQTGAA